MLLVKQNTRSGQMGICSNQSMELDRIWLANFRQCIDLEIAAADKKKAAGRREFAQKIGIGEQFAYQLYSGKSRGGQRYPSRQVMAKVAEVYANGRSIDWINIHPTNDQIPTVKAVPGLSPLGLDLGMRLTQIDDIDRQRQAHAICGRVIAQIRAGQPPEPPPIRTLLEH